MAFNGGKMTHLWKTSSEPKLYLPEWTCREAEEAMLALSRGEAKAYRKIDGSCGAIHRGPNGWIIYQRYDSKGRLKDGLPEGYIELPDGENTGNGHSYYFRQLRHAVPDRISIPLYSQVEDLKLDKDFYTVELCGPNFNRTPGVSSNSIALHEAQDPHVQFPRLEKAEDWLDWLRVYFTENRDEGLVIEHKGKYWKMHSDKIAPSLSRKDYRAPVLLRR